MEQNTQTVSEQQQWNDSVCYNTSKSPCLDVVCTLKLKFCKSRENKVINIMSSVRTSYRITNRWTGELTRHCGVNKREQRFFSTLHREAAVEKRCFSKEVGIENRFQMFRDIGITWFRGFWFTWLMLVRYSDSDYTYDLKLSVYIAGKLRRHEPTRRRFWLHPEFSKYNLNTFFVFDSTGCCHVTYLPAVILSVWHGNGSRAEVSGRHTHTDWLELKQRGGQTVVKLFLLPRVFI